MRLGQSGTVIDRKDGPNNGLQSDAPQAARA
jgi:hypothetical protein